MTRSLECYADVSVPVVDDNPAEVRARVQGVLADKTLTHVFQSIQDLKAGGTVGHEASSRLSYSIEGRPT